MTFFGWMCLLVLPDSLSGVEQLFYNCEDQVVLV